MAQIVSPLMVVMQRAADKAVKGLLRDFGEIENLQVSEKSPGQFVTNADRRAEESIYYSLKKDRPEAGYLMEESGEVKGEPGAGRFIIDPIDGTHNFMRGIPNWCISIGYEENGEVTHGLIVDPLRNEIFTAEKGKGAFMNRRRIRVSGKKDVHGTTLAYWFVHKDEYKQETMHQCRSVEDALRKEASLRMIGSTCLELAWVAAGRLDGYIQGPLSPWDLAAGEVLIKEAGGVMSDWVGNKDRAIYSQYVIAGNPDIHPQLVAIAAKGC